MLSYTWVTFVYNLYPSTSEVHVSYDFSSCVEQHLPASFCFFLVSIIWFIEYHRSKLVFKPWNYMKSPCMKELDAYRCSQWSKRSFTTNGEKNNYHTCRWLLKLSFVMIKTLENKSHSSYMLEFLWLSLSDWWSPLPFDAPSGQYANDC